MVGAIIGAAFTIPAAFQMVIRTFPDPKEQGFALAIFGSSAALAGGLSFIFLLPSRCAANDLLSSRRAIDWCTLHPVPELALDLLDDRNHRTRHCSRLRSLHP
jgi:hypothetical protein